MAYPCFPSKPSVFNEKSAMMNYPMLTREEICRVIEGRGNARRIPALFHFWMHPDDFGDKAAEARSIMDAYP